MRRGHCYLQTLDSEQLAKITNIQLGVFSNGGRPGMEAHLRTELSRNDSAESTPMFRLAIFWYPHGPGKIGLGRGLQNCHGMME